jgi:hypothetical protein
MAWNDYLQSNGLSPTSQLASLPETSLKLDQQIEGNGLSAGTLNGKFNAALGVGGSSGSGYLTMDAPNEVVRANDGTRDRVLLGLINGDYGLEIFDSSGVKILDANSVNGLKITNINADNITAGTLTGRTVRTAASGERVVVNGATNELEIYDSSGHITFIFNSSGIEGYLPTGVSAGSIGIFSGYIGVTASDTIGLTAPTVIASADAIVAHDLIVGNDFTAIGTKAFLIDHPIKPNKKLQYVCPESPEVLLIFRGNGDIKLPDHFIAITEPDTLQTIKDPENGNWIVTGIRKGYKTFDCEPDIKVS